jgi:hypothetical protein
VAHSAGASTCADEIHGWNPNLSNFDIAALGQYWPKTALGSFNPAGLSCASNPAHWVECLTQLLGKLDYFAGLNNPVCWIGHKHRTLGWGIDPAAG